MLRLIRLALQVVLFFVLLSLVVAVAAYLIVSVAFLIYWLQDWIEPYLPK